MNVKWFIFIQNVCVSDLTILNRSTPSSWILRSLLLLPYATENNLSSLGPLMILHESINILPKNTVSAYLGSSSSLFIRCGQNRTKARACRPVAFGPLHEKNRRRKQTIKPFFFWYVCCLLYNLIFLFVVFKNFSKQNVSHLTTKVKDPHLSYSVRL